MRMNSPQKEEGKESPRRALSDALDGLYDITGCNVHNSLGTGLTKHLSPRKFVNGFDLVTEICRLEKTAEMYAGAAKALRKVLDDGPVENGGPQ